MDRLAFSDRDIPVHLRGDHTVHIKPDGNSSIVIDYPSDVMADGIPLSAGDIKIVGLKQRYVMQIRRLIDTLRPDEGLTRERVLRHLLRTSEPESSVLDETAGQNSMKEQSISSQIP